MAKRKNGEGCWGKKNIGKYVYIFYRDPEGRTTYGKTEKDVRQKLKEIQEKVEELEAVLPRIENDDEDITVGEFMSTWLYEKKYKDVGVDMDMSTFDCYENALKVRLYKNPFASMKLSELDDDAITRYLKDLGRHYAHGTIKKTWQVLRLGLKDKKFRLHDHLPELDFNEIKVPKERNCAVKTRVIQFTSNEDMDKLYTEALRKKSTGAYLYGNAARLLAFIMYSGLREAEAIGLKWKDVNLDEGLITVSQTYGTVTQRDENGIKIGYEYKTRDPKNTHSAATIPVRQKGIDILNLMNELYPKHYPEDFVFLTDTRTPFEKRHVIHTLKRMLRNCGLQSKNYSVHELRHGYGSILYQEGVDIYTISKLLRHKSVKTTMDIYLAATPENLRDKLSLVDNK